MHEFIFYALLLTALFFGGLKIVAALVKWMVSIAWPVALTLFIAAFVWMHSGESILQWASGKSTVRWSSKGPVWTINNQQPENSCYKDRKDE